jgi:hypothetical protein
MYQEARRRAKEEFFVESKTGKLLRRVRYICASCNGRFVDKPGAREIAVDHIIPVVDPMVGWVDIGTYAERLYCVVENLQVLCNYAGLRDGKKSCHKIKSAEERKIQAERQRKEK